LIGFILLMMLIATTITIDSKVIAGAINIINDGLNVGEWHFFTRKNNNSLNSVFCILNTKLPSNLRKCSF